MTRILSIDQVAELAWGAGLRGEPLAVSIAVSKGESGFDADAVGDEHLADAKWGPSLSLWQIRSLRPAYLYLEPIRDPTKLMDPAYNARAMYQISKGGNDFTPWSVFTSGAYRNHLPAARRAANRRTSEGGSGTVSGGGGDTLLPTGATPDITVAVGSLSLRYRAPRRLDTLTLSGIDGTIPIAEYVIGGSVDLTATQVSEVTLDLVNPDLWFAQRGARHGARMSWDGLRLRVAALEVKQGKAVPEMRITCRSEAAEYLKRFEGDLAGHTNLSPTEYVLKLVRSAADTRYFEFVGEGSARRSDIAPLISPDGKMETAWEVIQRLAEELGYMAFEAGDIFCFGRPSWLVDQGVEVKVGWRNAWGDERLDAIELPTIRNNSTDDPVTLTCKLPRWRGEQVRPGMRLVLKGVYGVPSTYLVTRAQWPIDAGIEPVTVEAIQPVDPQPGIDPAELTPGAPASPPSPSGGAGNVGAPGGSYPRITYDQRTTHFGQPGDPARRKQVTTPWRITVTCHAEVAARFLAACEEAKAASDWRPRRIDSYNKRYIAGTTTWSLHSWPLAWDIFATPPNVPPPGGVRDPVNGVHEDFGRVFERWGFTWGKRWTGRNIDVPHIEWASYPPRAIGNSSGGATGAHPPGGGPLP